MHILHVETGTKLYGGARQVLMLLDGLARLGVRSTLACPAKSAIAEAAAAAGHDVARLDFQGDLDPRLRRQLTALIDSTGADLLHAHSRRGADLHGGLAARGRVPAVLTRRVDNPDTPLVGRLKYRHYDRVVAISNAVLEQLHANGIPDERLRLVRSAVEDAPLEPAWDIARFRSTFGLEPETRSVGVIAQLIPRKGHGFLLDAWSRVRARTGDARLLIFGQGPLDSGLRARAAGDDSIVFAGFRPDLRQFLGHLDLVVHTAVREGLGVALLEAQAAGVPVAGFAAGGVAEAVLDGITGRLVPPGDVAALADAMTALLDNGDLRRQLGEAGRDRVRREFSPARMAAAYVDIYRELLGGPTGNERG